MPDEAPLSGGTINPVYRVGDTVRRPAGPWTPAVHALLRHLETFGFDAAPRVLGMDSDGREVLAYIEGVAGFVDGKTVRPPDLWSDQVLVEAAGWLRRFHDATAGFIPDPDAEWQVSFPDAACHEVICHNDVGPYNCIFADGRLKAVIDFDLAGPGPRAWDVAYGAYRFVPVVAPDSLAQFGLESGDTGRRLRLFCDAYRLQQREGFVEVLQERIDATWRMLVDGAGDGNIAFQRLIDEPGRLESYRRDLRHVRNHAAELQAAVESTSGRS